MRLLVIYTMIAIIEINFKSVNIWLKLQTCWIDSTIVLAAAGKLLRDILYLGEDKSYYTGT